MTIIKNMTYNSPTGKWSPVFGPQVPVNQKTKKEVVTPRTKPNVPTPPKKNADTTPQKTAEKLYREKEFTLEGSASIFPNPEITANTIVEFFGLGTVFSGRYYIKAVKHQWDSSGGYTQEIEVTRNGFGGTSEPPKTASQTNSARPEREKIKTESKDIYYVVKVGDSLWSIAKSFYGDGTQYNKIATANGITNVSLIKVGQRLLIP